VTVVERAIEDRRREHLVAGERRMLVVIRIEPRPQRWNTSRKNRLAS